MSTSCSLEIWNVSWILEYKHTHTHTRIYIYIYIYIHTRTHTQFFKELPFIFPTDCHLTDTIMYMRGPGNSVGLWAARSGIESRWGRDFPPVQTGPVAHPASCTMGTGSFPGVNCGRGVLLATHPLLVPRSWKSRAVPLPTLWATPGL